MVTSAQEGRASRRIVSEVSLEYDNYVIGEVIRRSLFATHKTLEKNRSGRTQPTRLKTGRTGIFGWVRHRLSC